LIALVTRLYDPSEGKIRIGGTNIRRIPLRKLRHAVGNVLHTAHVFSGTIADNISYGDPDATPEEIEAAARVVELHDFIVGQPKGYQTLIGRGGEQLDQEHLIKLNLARAIVTNPAILTVDDTYAGLEEEVEERLRIAVRGALKDKTVLLATSRLSVCEDADLVIVMEKGKIAQTGAHAALLAVPGLYRRMYMRQMGIEELEKECST
jgi:ATP-binding cassette subfamily B protein